MGISWRGRRSPGGGPPAKSDQLAPRLASTPSRGVYYDGAYAPYGENYAETGTTDRNFAGLDQAMVSSGSYPLYDFLMREYHPTWGRWISPDPAGLAAVNPMNPQTWNRYAYVGNNPLSFVDPMGLVTNQCNGTLINGTCYNNGPPPPINPCVAGLQAPQCGNMPPCTTYGCPSSYPSPGTGGGTGTAAAPPGNPQTLPKGKKPCPPSGNADSPAQYASLGKNAGPVVGLLYLPAFQRGAGLDAQAYGASPAYANYVYGVYLAAAGYRLGFALWGADTYAHISGATAVYVGNGDVMDSTYAGIPAVNVGNIKAGYDDEKAGTLCSSVG